MTGTTGPDRATCTSGGGSVGRGENLRMDESSSFHILCVSRFRHWSAGGPVVSLIPNRSQVIAAIGLSVGLSVDVPRWDGRRS